MRKKAISVSYSNQLEIIKYISFKTNNYVLSFQLSTGIFTDRVRERSLFTSVEQRRVTAKR